jgi:hypothetical protein
MCQQVEKSLFKINFIELRNLDTIKDQRLIENLKCALSSMRWTDNSAMSPNNRYVSIGSHSEIVALKVWRTCDFGSLSCYY